MSFSQISLAISARELAYYKEMNNKVNNKLTKFIIINMYL